MTWAQFGLAVAGGAVGAALTQIATLGRDWWNREDEGRFTALMLALALEDYASRCTEPVFTLDNYVSSRENTAEPSGSLPTLPPFPDKTNWRALGIDTASAVLGVRVTVDSASSYLASIWEFEGSESAWGAAADKAIEVGAATLAVAGQLRSRFKLGPPPQQDFDAAEFFTTRLADLKARKARAVAEAAEFWKDLDEPAPDSP